VHIAAAQVYTGDSSFLEATEYHMPSTSALEAMSTIVRRGGETLGRIYNLAIDEVCEQITDFRDSKVGRRLMGAKHAIDNVENSNNIRTFKTCEELFGAPLSQLRFLAVAPPIQRYSKKGMIDGYKGRFFNPYKDIPLEENPDYQKVYTTMGVEKDDDIVFVTYANNYDQDDLELSFEQKCSIIDNHQMMKHLIENDVDCTSEYGDKL